MWHKDQTYGDLGRDAHRMVQRGSMPHALSAVSQESSRALPLVWGLVAHLHCLDGGKEAPCQRCSACLKVGQWVHSDAHVVFPLPAGGSKGSNDVTSLLPLWRSFLQQGGGDLAAWATHVGGSTAGMCIVKEQVHRVRRVVRQKPFESHCKSVLLWLPELMHPAAANALLKVVEEPPAETFFLLVSSSPHQVLPTLRSRTCTLRIPPLDDATLQAILTRRHPTVASARLLEVVAIAQGNLSLASSMLVNGAWQRHFTFFAAWMRAAYAQQLGQLTELASTFHAHDTATRRELMCYGFRLFRHVLALRFDVAHGALLAPAAHAFCEKFGQTVSIAALEHVVDRLHHLDQLLLRNANARLAFMDVSLHVAALLRKEARQRPPAGAHAAS